MKKIMVMVAAVAVAAFAQAASVDWTFSHQALDKNAPASLEGYTAYLFTASTWTDAVTAGVTADIFSSAVDTSALTKTVGGSGENTWAKYATGKQTWTADAASNGSYYIVLFDGNQYVASEALDATAYNSALEAHTMANWTVAANKAPLTNADFTQVPEPTSGLLLALGLAGLALRRRRA